MQTGAIRRRHLHSVPVRQAWLIKARKGKPRRLFIFGFFVRPDAASVTRTCDALPGRERPYVVHAKQLTQRASDDHGNVGVHAPGRARRSRRRASCLVNASSNPSSHARALPPVLPSVAFSSSLFFSLLHGPFALVHVAPYRFNQPTYRTSQRQIRDGRQRVLPHARLHTAYVSEKARASRPLERRLLLAGVYVHLLTSTSTYSPIYLPTCLPTSTYTLY